ncbi:MAG TPA: sn-glycerol-3-phosphate ABC transporter ATP-binding protein UgpC [Bacillota bacterium]|jgi:multiple sugar transport system ATP-binding protein|nr:sn-glycerol-3-phosphate ABC transporter ATP-binding protein UgpC [Fastidiosipila sp.]HPX93573.1 sn-glycerol-3-phosphate ABC transporter ATP-binding protein UgpC [Bacillota bacterium]HQB80548.1 sn-glycerol-3-phosphate ABC transporter ATP-binding protein UgpC [Bacillota bacterium]
MKVDLVNIGKKYEGRENFTIRHIDLEIEDKEFCVILGPSGCGKSTLLRMIAGLNSITEGDLLFDGKRMNKVEPKDRDIAMVFQSYALYPHMTVYDNMAFSLKMRREKKTVIHDRVIEAAELLQITEYLYSKPSEISGGQRQRVALGRAMVRKAGVFLLDEPLSNLDAKLREHMRVELVRLHKSLDTTSIYVTHDQTEAMTMATKIVLLDDGKVQQAGRPSEFYEKPANLFVAGFIGSPTMNTFPGVIEKGLFKADGDLFTVEPGQEDKKKLSGHEGKRVVMGIRSERFLAGKAEKNGITVEVDVIEMLGKEQLLYCKFPNGKECVISEPGHFKYAIDEEHNFHLDTQGLHFFDEETSGRIN